MSGYKYQLLIQFDINGDFNYSISDAVKNFNAFIIGYFNEIGISVVSLKKNEFENHVEIILFEVEYSITSFSIFYEFCDGKLALLSIVDLSNLASEVIRREDFFERVTNMFKSKVNICNAFLLLDPAFINYKQLINEVIMNNNKFDIIKALN